MYGFEGIGIRELNKENILRRVPEESLWRHYFGPFQVGRTYKSPLRVDPIPSFSIFYARRLGGKIMAKDHGGNFCGDIFDYVRVTEHLDFYQALVKINSDFTLGLLYKADKVTSTIEVRQAQKTIITAAPKIPGIVYEVEHRPPTQSDLDYWGSYGITRPTLRMYNVFCVNVLWCNGNCCYTYTPGDPCYQYRFKSGNSKFYRPFAGKGYKFRGNIDNNIDIQGYYQCQMNKEKLGDLLVITKSLKDVMLLREYGIEAVAIHGENHKFNTDFVRHIKERYTRIVSLYDRDREGMRGARYLWKEFGIDWIFIPKGSGKDLTDFYKLKGKEKVDEFIVRLRHNTIKTCVPLR